MKSWLIIAGLAAVASAEPIEPTHGFVERGREPGSFWLSTDAVPGRFSSGEVSTKRAVKLPYRIDVAWRRIGPESGRSMHLTVADGVVLIKSGKLALYAFDEAKFAAEGWTQLPGYDAHAEHDVSVTQTAKELIVVIDGKEAKRFVHPTARHEIRTGVGMKGAPGYRSTIYVRSLSVTEL